MKDLRAQVKSASLKLAQTERQLNQISQNLGTGTSQGAPPTTKLDQQPPSTTTPTPGDKREEDPAPGGEESRVDPREWYQLEVLRAQHGVLVEDLERSDDDAAAEGGGGGGGDEGLRERTLLTAACWQLRDNDGSPGAAEGEARRHGDAELELAAVVVAAGLTSASSGLAQTVHEALEWEVSCASRGV